MIQLVKQPVNSRCCGQACVAMLAGVTLNESVRIFGKRSTTTTKDVVAALRKLGIQCGDRAVRLGKGVWKSGRCMVVVHAKGDKKYLHWVVYGDGRYYDPAAGIAPGLNEPHYDPHTDEYREYEIERYETSYLPVYRGGA